MEGYAIGAVLIGIGLLMGVLAYPRGGQTRRWLTSNIMFATFPSLVMAFLVMGIVELISAFYSK